MSLDAKLQAWAQRVDRRRLRRVRVTLQGKLFVTGEQREVDCVITDLSPGGAGIQCKTPPPRRKNVVLYIPGFGRFEGVSTQPTRDGTGICFECTARKQKRISDQLKLYVKEGLTAVTQLRESQRIEQVAIPSFTMPDGEIMECEVLDISLTGTSLKTIGRPPVDEVIQLGRMAGRVVRHHESGIGVQFIGESGR
jgi:c-di-GMP-binding flagellar brake protein YcgR